MKHNLYFTETKLLISPEESPVFTSRTFNALTMATITAALYQLATHWAGAQAYHITVDFKYRCSSKAMIWGQEHNTRCREI